MNRKEKRAEAKRNHNIQLADNSSNINPNQEENMDEIITIETELINKNTNQGENTMANDSQPGFFTRIKNAFRNGYREGKACIKEQVQEIKETYTSALEENRNPVIAHAKATVKTTFHILKKSIKAFFSLIALPFIKLDTFIDPQTVTQS